MYLFKPLVNGAVGTVLRDGTARIVGDEMCIVKERLAMRCDTNIRATRQKEADRCDRMVMADVWPV